jgi:hypothetical protein
MPAGKLSSCTSDRIRQGAYGAAMTCKKKILKVSASLVDVVQKVSVEFTLRTSMRQGVCVCVCVCVCCVCVRVY